MGNTNPKMEVKYGLESWVNLYEEEQEKKNRELEDKIFGLKLKHPKRIKKKKQTKLKFISDMKKNNNERNPSTSIHNAVQQARKEQDMYVYNFSKTNLVSEIHDRKYNQLQRLYNSSRSSSSRSSISSSISEGSILLLNQKRDELFNAIRHNNFNVAEEILYESPKHKKLTDKFGNTILHVACQNNAKKMVKLALKLGVNIDAVNADGQTALHYCFVYKYNKLGWYLMSKGASGHVKNKYGLLPREGLSFDKYAKQSKQTTNFGTNSMTVPVNEGQKPKHIIRKSSSVAALVRKPLNRKPASIVKNDDRMLRTNASTGKLRAFGSKPSSLVLTLGQTTLPPLKRTPKKLPPLQIPSNHTVVV